MIKELEEWISEVDQIIENETDYTIFISEYGKEFYKDYSDLIEVGYLYIFPKSVSVFQEEMDKIESLEQAKTIILELLQHFIKIPKLNSKEKKLSKEILTKLEKEFDEIIEYIRSKKSVLSNIFEEFNNLTETAETEEEKKEMSKSSIMEVAEQMNLFYRINAYYVIALYAIIDVYCMSFIQDSFSSCSKEIVYESLNKLAPSPSDPVDSLNKGLKIHDKENFKTIDIRSKLIKSLKWEIHQESFTNFKDLRKVPAHKKAVLTLEEIKIKFKKQYEKAEKLFKEIKRELDKDVLPDKILQPLLKGIEDLKIGLFLREIGNSCIRYLILNEAILQYILDKDNFLETTTRILENRKEDK